MTPDRPQAGDDPGRAFPDVMTIEEVAAFLRIPLSSVYKLAQTGKIPSRKAGRHWRFSRRALRSWLEAGHEAETSAAKTAQDINPDPSLAPRSSLEE